MIKEINNTDLFERKCDINLTTSKEVLREIAKLGFNIFYEEEDLSVKYIKYHETILQVSNDTFIDLAGAVAELLFENHKSHQFARDIKAINEKSKVPDVFMGYYNADPTTALLLMIKINTLLPHPARKETTSKLDRQNVHLFYIELARVLHDLARKFECERYDKTITSTLNNNYNPIKREEINRMRIDASEDIQAFFSSKCETRTTNGTMTTKDEDETNKDPNIKINNNKLIEDILKQDNTIDLNKLKAKDYTEKRPKIEYREMIFVYDLKEFMISKADITIEWHKLPDVVKDVVKNYYDISQYIKNEKEFNNIIGIDKDTGKYLIRLGATNTPRLSKDTTKIIKKFTPNYGKPANFYVAASLDIFNKNNILPPNCKLAYTDLPENIKIFIEQYAGLAIEIGIDKDQKYVIYTGKHIDDKDAIKLNGVIISKDERANVYEPVGISDKDNIPFKAYEFKSFEGCTAINLYNSFKTPSFIQYADIGEVGKDGEMRFMFDTVGDEAMDLTSCRTIILPIKFSKIKEKLLKIGIF